MKALLDPAGLRQALPALDHLNDPDTERLVTMTWLDLWVRSSWPNIADASAEIINPRRPRALGDYLRLTDHTCHVADATLRILNTWSQRYGLPVDHNLALASALLHDAGKLVAYEPGPVGPRRSAEGQRSPSWVFATQALKANGGHPGLEHLIAVIPIRNSVVPTTREGVAVSYAKMALVDAWHHLHGEPMPAIRKRR